MMKSLVVSLILISLILICGLLVICAAAELTGTVRSKAGNPLADVTILSRCRGLTETDVNGSFKFPDRGPVNCGRVVFFWTAGFIPQIKIVDEATREIHVVMEEAAGQGRVVPSCSNIPTRGRWLGWPLRVRVPKGASVEKYRGLHGHGYSIRVKSKKRRIELNGYIDQYAFGYPPDNLILTAAEFTIRIWRSGQAEGMDFRGRAPNGMRWRYFTIIGEEVYYDDVSDEEARILDGIIDGACFESLSER